MKIVYIDDFFHPDAGYHMNLLSKYWSMFGHEVILLTAEAEKTPSSLKSFFDYNDIETKDKLFEDKNNVKIYRMPIYRVISGRAVYKHNIFDKIAEINPDIVYCNGNDSLIGMQLTIKDKKANYGLVLDSHMLAVASRNKFKKLYYWVYRRFFTPIIIKNSIPVIRTQEDDYIEKALGIPLSNSPYISFGSDTLNFHPDTTIRKRFREANGISDDTFVILYAGKLNKAKGIELLGEVVKKKLETKRKILFMIVGGVDSSIPDANHFFDDSENEVLRFPTQKYPDLPQFYQASDLVIFPKQCSLSFFDAQACGVPVVFEDNQLNMTRAKNGNALTFKADNAEDFRAKMIEFIEMDKDRYHKFSQNAIDYIKRDYNYEDKAREYIPILESRLKTIRSGR